MNPFELELGNKLKDTTRNVVVEIVSLSIDPTNKTWEIRGKDPEGNIQDYTSKIYRLTNPEKQTGRDMPPVTLRDKIQSAPYLSLVGKLIKI